MDLTIILHNIRSTYNVGAILRSAEGLGIPRVILSGYTPKYNDETLLPHLRDKINRQIEKSALGAETLVPLENIADLDTWIVAYRSRGGIILGLENNLAADELAKRFYLGTEAFWRQLAKMQAVQNAQPEIRIALLLGEEVNGISPDLRRLMDLFVEIPMYGQKESFNVSVAASIAMWTLISRAKISS